MHKIKLAVFNMTGTCVDDKKGLPSSFAQACEATGLEVPLARLASMHELPQKEAFRMLWEEKLGKKNSDLEDYVDFSYQTFCEILENYYQELAVRPTMYCCETFDTLTKNNIKIALTTHIYRKAANIILKKLGWLQGLNEDFVNIGGPSPIHVSVTPSEVENGHSASAMIFRAMQLLSVESAAETLKIGDTPNDLQAGKEAGCGMVLAVGHGTYSEEQLAIYPNMGILKHLGELPAILGLEKSAKPYYFTF
ncbi:HAD hydrolase-like protein [Marinilongibacter aquaticus]|uniref:HAD family hydrolase n=1 Tax=Marinilongibacter aquaticus TaxID=2975157 RepID=UPI0021BD6154|nr:HAD hydrolase-like protein [Marinilongibacter aquaticus]UBM58107.1 HAD hydrolase-like protein [Marinilongibacter aquaticus]